MGLVGLLIIAGIICLLLVNPFIGIVLLVIALILAIVRRPWGGASGRRYYY